MTAQPSKRRFSTADIDDIRRAISNGYHNRNDYPPFSSNSFHDRFDFEEYIYRVMGEMTVPEKAE